MIYKIKQTATGSEKAILKTDEFNPPKDARSRFEKVNRTAVKRDIMNVENLSIIML